MNVRKEKSSYDLLGDLAKEVEANYGIEQAFRDTTGTQLLKTGNSRVACCPFHKDSNPSMSVDITAGLYKCHAAGCGAQGNLFTLLMASFGVDYRGAVLQGANLAGIQIPDALEEARSGKTYVPPMKRAFPLPPEDAIKPIPEDLGEIELTALSRHAVLPAAGSTIFAWDPTRQADKRVRRFTPAMIHAYRDIDGHVLFLVLRCEMSKLAGNGKKEKFFVPLRHDESQGIDMRCFIPKSGERSWVVGGFAGKARRPLYGLEGVKAALQGASRVLIVEGEKTADATRSLLSATNTDMAVLSPFGGGASPAMSDWRPVLESLQEDGRIEVIIWPDADKLMERPDGTLVDRQDKFAKQVATGLFQTMIDMNISPARVRALRVTPPADVESGWDLADAETQGWSGIGVLDHIKNFSVAIDEAGLPFRDQKDGHAMPRSVEHDLAQGGEAENLDLSEFDDVLSELNQTGQDVASAQARPAFDLPVQIVDPADELVDDHDPEDGGNWDDVNPGQEAVLRNPHFRCLGFSEGVDFYISLESGFIYGLNPQMMRSNYFLKLARKEFWLRYFPSYTSRGAPTDKVDWEAVTDAMIRGSYLAGTWDPAREMGQGASIDEGRVVFNTGSHFFVEGVGKVNISEFRGSNCYVMGTATQMPDFDNPFGANAPEILKYLEITSALNWKEERRNLSILGLFGWTCVSVIGGIMSWRPHLWLDGPRSSGKTWIIKNLVSRALGDYCIRVKANTTEPGIRHQLNAKSFPLIFDEAEGETAADRARVDAIIKLARHSASEDGGSTVTTGMPGGIGQRRFIVRSSFLLTSITSQIDAPADQTRFARAHLNEGRQFEEFIKRIEGPAEELLTPDFSRRFIARMVMRAPDFQKTFAKMLQALTLLNLERRIVDVYGTFAAGAWLMLRDGVPADVAEAADFVGSTFDIVDQIQDFGQDIGREKDHFRLFHLIQSSSVRVESPNFGNRVEYMGSLIEAASGFGQGECCLSQADAIRVLKGYGIRPACIVEDNNGKRDFQIIDNDGIADCIVIHRNTETIRSFLKETGYARDYSQVMLQSEKVFSGRAVRFSSALGVGKSIVVPLSMFALGEDYEE